MNNIFIKKDQISNDKIKYIIDRKVLPKNDIMDSIPKNSLNEEDKNFALTKTETRWRIFKFPNIENEIVEISQKNPNNERLYLNQNNKWHKKIDYDDNKYNKYMIKKYYHYE